MNKWLIFFLTASDSIKYISSDMNSISMMSYKNFLKYLKTYKVFGLSDVIREINTYRTIKLNEDGTWEIIPIDFGNPDFATLQKLNPKKKKVKVDPIMKHYNKIRSKLLK